VAARGAGTFCNNYTGEKEEEQTLSPQNLSDQADIKSKNRPFPPLSIRKSFVGNHRQTLGIRNSFSQNGRGAIYVLPILNRVGHRPIFTMGIMFLSKRPEGRRTIRSKYHDYRNPDIYFITLCTRNKNHLFGKIINEQMILNPYGKIVLNEWMNTPMIRPSIAIDQFAIMPNHFHGLIEILDVRAWRRHAPTPRLFSRPLANSISTIIGSFKSIVTKRINKLRSSPDGIWQTNYYERIIRSEQELERVREYIRNNPKNWHRDRNNK
jgi:putative transposase